MVALAATDMNCGTGLDGTPIINGCGKVIDSFSWVLG